MRTRRQHRSVRSGYAMVAVLAALLALRMFWVPVHLALEPHDADHAHGHAHESSEPGRDERDGHDPHPSADHLTDLVAARVADHGELAALVLGGGISIAAPPTTRAERPRVAEVVPRPPPPRTGRARAPPAS